MRSRSPSSVSNSSGRTGYRRVVDDQARFHQVRKLAQTHGPGHARAALEGMQRPAQLPRAAGIAGGASPRAHLLAGLRVELRRLLEKNRQHLRVDVVTNFGQRILRHLAARGIGDRGGGRRRQRRDRRRSDVVLRRRHLGHWRNRDRQPILREGRLGFGGELVELPEALRSPAARRPVPGHRLPAAAARRPLAQPRPAALPPRSAGSGSAAISSYSGSTSISGATGSMFAAWRSRLELLPDLRRDRLVRGIEAMARLDARDEFAESADGVGQRRQRVHGHGRTPLLQREQCLFECAGCRCDQRQIARAVNPAQRMARAHHGLGRQHRGIELQQRKLVLAASRDGSAPRRPGRGRGRPGSWHRRSR